VNPRDRTAIEAFVAGHLAAALIMDRAVELVDVVDTNILAVRLPAFGEARFFVTVDLDEEQATT
jgi:hypothetical protein